VRKVLDLKAPIVPAESLAGLRIGANIGEYEDVIRAATDWDDQQGNPVQGRQWVRAWGFQISYRLPQLWYEQPKGQGQPLGVDAVEVTVDVRSGEITRLSALEGYKGSLLGKINVGTTYGEVRSVLKDLAWSGMVVAEASESTPGVAFHFVSQDGVLHDGLPEEARASDRLEQIDVFRDPMGGGVSL